MNFGEAIRHNFRNAFSFAGRDPRSAFWWFVLFWYLGSLVANLIDMARWITIAPSLLEKLGMSENVFAELANRPWIVFQFFPATLLWVLLGIVPLFSCGIRRRHDCDRSGVLFAVLFIGASIVSITASVYLFGAIGARLEPAADVEGISPDGSASPEELLRAEFSAIFAFAAIVNLVLLTAATVIILMMAAKGTHGPNRYGPDPLSPAPMPQP